MKKSLFIIVFISCALMLKNAPPVFAEDPANVETVSLVTTNQTAVAGSPEASATPTPIEYSLPFPGLLPDNPLYLFKNLRDRIMEMLIADPLKKTEFYVLQADKRLAMTIALSDQGKWPLAVTTESKGSKYMDKAIGMLRSYAKDGKPVPGYLTSRIETSIAKHQEVIKSLSVKAPSDAIDGLKGSSVLFSSLLDQLHAIAK